VVVMRDFNFGEIDWIINLGGSWQGQDFLDVVGDCFVTQKVLALTRGDKIMDLVSGIGPPNVLNRAWFTPLMRCTDLHGKPPIVILIPKDRC